MKGSKSTPTRPVNVPEGYELVSLRELPQLAFPLQGDPRRRLDDGVLLHQWKDTPRVLDMKITSAEFQRKKGRNIDERAELYVYWRWEGWACGFSGVGESARPGLDGSFIAIKKRSGDRLKDGS